MDNLQEAINHDDLPGSPRSPSESTNLVSQNSKPNYLNVVSNVCSLVFFVGIIYFSFAQGVSLFSFHPVFMGVAWVLLFPSGINSITPGDIATEWMPARLRSKRHWIIQMLGLIFALTGSTVIVTNKIIHGNSHFVSLHSIFGLIAMTLMVSTSLGGVGALYGLKLKDYVAPIYTKMIHTFAGMITFTFGMITIMLILFAPWFIYGEVLRYISLVLVLVILFLTLLRPLLKFYFRLQERMNFIRS